MSRLHAAVLAAILASTAVFPAAAATPALDAGATFQVQRDAILKALEDGETYIEIRSTDRDRVRELLGRIETLLAGKSRLDELSEDAKVQAFNDQQEINALLTRALTDSRMVCEREQKVGSHRRTTSCMTVAARRRARDAAQDAVMRANVRRLEQEQER